MYGESKNAFLYSVQNPHLPVRDGRLPRLMQSSIGPRTEICGNLGLPFAKVPCLHQSSIYIKTIIPVWRVQKRIPLVGAKTALTTTGQQTTPSHVRQYRTENGNLRKSGSTFRHGTVLHQNNPYINRNLKTWRVQKCIPLVGSKTVITMHDGKLPRLM